MTSALADMTVVDISQQLPGPYASALLADLGARVIKVEPPFGDPARHLDPDMFALVNVGKEVVELDLKSSTGVEALHELVAAADVFLEGFRPGVAARLGAGWPELSRLNPRLVYCSISACGQDGPFAGVPMHDLNLQGLADLDPEDRMGVPWVDLGTGTTAALAIAAAWHAAKANGSGVHLDAAMLDTAALWGRVKASAHGREEPTYGVFATADGHRVAVAILEDHIWTRLCAAFAWLDWRNDAGLARYADRVRAASEIRTRLAAACAARGIEELLRLAQDHDLPLTPVGASHSCVAVAQMAGRDLDGGSGRRLPLARPAPTAPVTEESRR